MYKQIQKLHHNLINNFATKRRTQEQIKEIGTWVAAAILGVGVALSITLVFMPAGMWLILLGAAVGVITWAASLVVPNLFRYQEIRCPYCREINLVRPSAIEYDCDACTRKLKGVGFWRRKQRSAIAAKSKKSRIVKNERKGA